LRFLQARGTLAALNPDSLIGLRWENFSESRFSSLLLG